MAKRSITQRWLINSLGIILIIIIIIEVVFSVAVQNYYYNSTKQHLTSKLNLINSMLLKASQDQSANFSAELRNYVQNFSDKDRMELMAINIDGI